MDGRLSGAKRVEPRHVCRTDPENREWQRSFVVAGLHQRELGADKLPAKVGNVNADAVRAGLAW